MKLDVVSESKDENGKILCFIGRPLTFCIQFETEKAENNEELKRYEDLKNMDIQIEVLCLTVLNQDVVNDKFVEKLNGQIESFGFQNVTKGYPEYSDFILTKSTSLWRYQVFSEQKENTLHTPSPIERIKFAICFLDTMFPSFKGNFLTCSYYVACLVKKASNKYRKIKLIREIQVVFSSDEETYNFYQENIDDDEGCVQSFKIFKNITESNLKSVFVSFPIEETQKYFDVSQDNMHLCSLRINNPNLCLGETLTCYLNFHNSDFVNYKYNATLLYREAIPEDLIHNSYAYHEKQSHIVDQLEDLCVDCISTSFNISSKTLSSYSFNSHILSVMWFFELKFWVFTKDQLSVVPSNGSQMATVTSLCFNPESQHILALSIPLTMRSF